MTIVDFSQWATSGHSKSRIGSIFSFCYSSRSSTSVADSISLVTTTRESRAFTLMDTTEAARSTLVQNHSKSLILLLFSFILKLRDRNWFSCEFGYFWRENSNTFEDRMDAILGVKIEMRLLMGFSTTVMALPLPRQPWHLFFISKIDWTLINDNVRRCQIILMRERKHGSPLL